MSVVGVVFSKDRAMQLRALLDSFMLHCQDYEEAKLHVIYKASDDMHLCLYNRLEEIYKGVVFEKEINIIDQLLSIISGNKWVLFLVDDAIFLRQFVLADVLKSIRKHDNVLGFNFIIGKNIEKSYMARRSCNKPEFKNVDVMVGYDWTTGDGVYGYPFNIVASVYRVKDVLPVIANQEECTVNGTESWLHHNRNRFLSRPLMLCYPISVAMTNPVNVVQTCRPNNRFGEEHRYTVEELAAQMMAGFHIDVSCFSGFVPKAPHTERSFVWVKDK